MPDTITLSAHAKINLFLDILSRRENGYHNIHSLMQSVTLCDTVTLTRLPEGEGIVVKTDIPSLPCDRRNLAYRAAERFAPLIGRTPDVSIHIEKRIPMSAGLAGGSADAAAVLRGLNLLYGTHADTETLCGIGASLGADIPFCIMGGSMLAEGIGERLTPCRGLAQTMWLVIACGGEGVSTPEAYRALDERYADFAEPRPVSHRFALLQRALEEEAYERFGEGMYNIFEEVILPARPIVTKLLTSLREDGALAAMMSGSGPSVFGVFVSEESARAAADAITRKHGIPAHVTRPN